MVVSLNPKEKKHRKDRISGYLVLWGGVGNYGPLIIFGNWLLSPVEVLLLFASVGNTARKASAERIGEGRVFGACSSWPCV